MVANLWCNIIALPTIFKPYNISLGNRILQYIRARTTIIDLQFVISIWIILDCSCSGLFSSLENGIYDNKEWPIKSLDSLFQISSIALKYTTSLQIHTGRFSALFVLRTAKYLRAMFLLVTKSYQVTLAV